MRKLSASFLTAMLILTIFPICNVYASESVSQLEIIYYDDGSYLEIVIEDVPTSRASTTKTKSKSYIYHKSDDTSAWKLTATGTFTYNGSSASCTESNCTVAIYDSKWSVLSKSATKSKNVAYGTAVMENKILATSASCKTYKIALTCDANGNFS